MNDDKYTLESGHLDVGHGHSVYFQRWGNPTAPPIFFLHGGPGSSCRDKNKLTFNPEKQQVIFHDQRGGGLSTPFASIKNNTSQDLITDVEKLRQKFGFESIMLLGHSWGSTLAMLYAIAYPKNVNKMLISGILTGSRKEIEYLQQGGLKTHYPDAWDKYIELVPEEYRQDTAKYYLQKMQQGSEEEQELFVSRWNLLEGSAMSFDSDFALTEQQSQEYDEKARALAILEAHYFIHNCFIEDNYMLGNAHTLKNIPVVIVHGRYDHVCTPENAYQLAKALGDNCHLHIVPGSHEKSGALREVQRAYAWSFLS